MNVKAGYLLKRIGSKRTYRLVEKVDGTRVYLRKPNGVPERVNIWDIGTRWEVVQNVAEVL